MEPGLATGAEWADPVTFVIDLRDDVTFWDGTPMTADDVVYSLDRNRAQTSAWFPSFVLVEAIEKTGDHQVTVRFTAPDSTFRDALSGAAGAVMSKAFGEAAGADLGTSSGGILCTGPFELADWTPGTQIVTSANPDYWGGAPLVDTLTYVFVSDGTTLATALLEGEIDGAYNVPPASRSSFETSDEGRLILGPSTASYSFGPTRSTGAGANPQIRQALSLAIDREQYIQTVLNGLGQTQKTFTPPFAWGGWRRPRSTPPPTATWPRPSTTSRRRRASWPSRARTPPSRWWWRSPPEPKSRSDRGDHPECGGADRPDGRDR